jgi:hypothetical protein
LPYELLKPIVEYSAHHAMDDFDRATGLWAVDHRTAAGLARTCWKLYHIANPLLYTEFIITFERMKRVATNSFALLQRTVSSDSTRAIQCWELRLPESTDCGLSAKLLDPYGLRLMDDDTSFLSEHATIRSIHLEYFGTTGQEEPALPANFFGGNDIWKFPQLDSLVINNDGSRAVREPTVTWKMFSGLIWLSHLAKTTYDGVYKRLLCVE